MPKLYGRVERNNAIAANATHTTYSDRELPGHLELYGIMVAPDLNADNTSNLELCRLLINDRQVLFDMTCNYYYNMLPFAGIHPGKRPIALLQPTLKIPKGSELAIVFVAGATAVSSYYFVRPVGLLYDDDEVTDVFGVAPEEFGRLEGGIEQGPERVEPFIKYGRNQAATSPGTWYDIEDLSFRIYAHQELRITHIGCRPHSNLANVQIADIDRRPVTEHPFTTDPSLNELPYGNAWQDSGPYEFIEAIQPVFTDDYVRIQIRDNGTSIPADGVIVHVRGTWTVRS